MRVLTYAVPLVIVVGLAGCGTESGRDFPVFFPTDEMTLTPDAQQVVADVAKAAGETRTSQIVVSGEADGGTPHDAELAYRRAATVVQALQQSGVPPQRIELRPGAPASDEHGVAAHKVLIQINGQE